MGVEHSTVGGYGFKISQKVAEKYLVEHDHHDGGAWEFFTELAGEYGLSYVEAGSYYGSHWPVGAFVAPSTEIDDDDLDGWTDEFTAEPEIEELVALDRLRREFWPNGDWPELGALIGGLWH